MNLNLDEASELQVTYGAKEYKVQKPKVKWINEFQRRSKEQSDDAELGAVYWILETCGMPKECLEEMTVEQLQKLVEALVPTKKS